MSDQKQALEAIDPDSLTAQDVNQLLSDAKDSVKDNLEDLRGFALVLRKIRSHTLTMLNQVDDRIDELEDSSDESDEEEDD